MEDTNKSIIYESRGLKRPGFNKIQRNILKLNKLPIVGNFSFVRTLICKIYSIPRTTLFGKDFYCPAPFLNLGKNVCLANTYTVAWAPITIGDNCSFSFQNMIIISTHDYNDFSTVIAKPITIGNDVWITSNVTILPGVTIGKQYSNWCGKCGNKRYSIRSFCGEKSL